MRWPARDQKRKAVTAFLLIVISCSPALFASTPALAVTLTASHRVAQRPLAMDCASSPTFEPHELSWCASGCSPSMRDIHWVKWGPRIARGWGTWVTRTVKVPAGTPSAIGKMPTGTAFTSCGRARTVRHPHVGIVLSDAKVETVCVKAKSRTLRLYTKSSPATGVTSRFWPRPPCVVP